ncbi:hypothetical protein BHE74_00029369 [Ensete ventricosum]|nr:hypothetical protein BHE74_00029369 [Ensete ventricosum]RZR97508.1 hypothetical protein BHM03_00026702 [Ensete ventricosum]
MRGKKGVRASGYIAVGTLLRDRSTERHVYRSGGERRFWIAGARRKDTRRHINGKPVLLVTPGELYPLS